MPIFSIKYEELCEFWSEHKCLEKVIEKIALQNNYNKEELLTIRHEISKTFVHQYNIKWNSASRKKEIFLTSNKDWLQKEFVVDLSGQKRTRYSDTEPSTSSSVTFPTTTRGRPSKSYLEAGLRSKRRKVQQLRKEIPKEQLIHAMNDMKKQNDSVSDPVDKVHVRNRALALYMDTNMTKQQYVDIRNYNTETGTSNDFYPAYQEIKLAKEDCYPEEIAISEKGASVKLKCLLNHTVRRIINSICDENIFEKIHNKKVTLHGKWGMDGSSGQQTFKQRFSSATSADSDNVNEGSFKPEDSSIFIVSFVPVILICNLTEEVLWKNSKPNSTRYCRPIEFMFMGETAEKTLNTYTFYTNELETIKENNIIRVNEEIECIVDYNIKCTMIDGKTCNVLTYQKASNSCNVCHATPKEMNNLNLIKEKKCNEETYKFGLSTLHCWIRFMEFVLHISYNMDFQCSMAKGDQNKELKKIKKKKVQDNLRNKLGILVDVVKQGYGSTNDGNTARKFFSNYEIVSQETGVSENLIKNFGVILQVLASGKNICIKKLKNFCHETAQLFVELYPWYYMPPSVHKVLIHGADIIANVSTTIPIGHLSEEALEAGNKVFKKCRKNFSSRNSRKDSNEDIFHQLLINSDPLITSLRKKCNIKPSKLTAEAISLLE